MNTTKTANRIANLNGKPAPFGTVDPYSIDLAKPGHYFCFVTPEVASDWLERLNINNRNLARGHSEYLAEIIRNGEWFPDHPAPIVFSDTGRLLDGQHRLYAIVLAGIAVWLRVQTGCPDGARKHIDTGRTRTLNDRIQLFDSPSQNSYASALINGWVRMAEKNTRRVTPAKAEEFFNLHRDSITWIVDNYTKEMGIRRTSVQIAFCEYYERNPEGASEFFTALKDPMTSIQQARMLRDWLLKNSFGATGGSASLEIHAKTVSACKCHWTGKPVIKLHAAKWDS